ncbi:3680_t:CDS:1, partial [Racocetra persica]
DADAEVCNFCLKWLIEILTVVRANFCFCDSFISKFCVAGTQE